MPATGRGPWAAAAMAACVLAAAALVTPAAAAIFEDSDARKAIIELRARLKDTQDAAKAAADQQRDDLQALRTAVLELNAQIERLRSELAQLRGANEQLVREVSEVQRQQKDIAQGVEDRVRKLEPVKVTVDGREFQAEPQEKRQYEDALAQLRSGEFGDAARAFAAFIKRYPNSGYLESAQFWLGSALYGKRDYKDAIAAYRVTAASTDHPRAAEALLAIANCQIEMKDTKAARATLADIGKRHAGTEVAKAAKERLASLPR